MYEAVEKIEYARTFLLRVVIRVFGVEFDSLVSSCVHLLVALGP